MFPDKYPSTFLRSMETIKLIILQIFFATHAIFKIRNCIKKSLHLHEYILGYLSADIICSEKRTVFRERSLRKTVSFEE